MSSGHKILTLNSGSSSLKFKLFELVSHVLKPIAWGVCERIGEIDSSRIKVHCNDGSEYGINTPFPDHSAALKSVSDYLKQKYSDSIATDVIGVGHRVVHGLSISDPVIITKDVIQKIDRATDVAPLHNPANKQGIQAAAEAFKDAVQVAVFDTAFHQTMPPEAYTYALPRELCKKYGIRKYGFHGTSYKYLSKRTANALGKSLDSMNAILCHLGAGASMCAVQGGKSVDTTMGLTPLQGLVMGTRCGDIDASIVPFLASKGIGMEEIEDILNKKSGFLGLAGQIDCRAVSENAAKADEDSILALKIFVRRIRHYLGAYFFQLGGQVDAIVFSAGIGENSSEIRQAVCSGLEWAGIKLDTIKNQEARAFDMPVPIHDDTSDVAVYVLPTDEELSIAEQTLELIE